VIFDLDDTLYPEGDYVPSGFRAGAEEVGCWLGCDVSAVEQELNALSDQVERDAWKPSKILFATALQELRVGSEESVYVPDNPEKDFAGANRLGMHTAQVCWPSGLYRECAAHSPWFEPDMKILDLACLEQVLSEPPNKSVAKEGARDSIGR